MKVIVTTSQFKRDLKLCKRRRYDMAKLQEVLNLLVRGDQLHPSQHDHALIGNWIPKRECHIAPDWLLIYEATPTELRLARTGSHSDLFGK